MLDEMWAAAPRTLAQQGNASGQSWPKDGEITFGEFLHAINPLQHLPVVGTIYRAITGDTIPAPMRLLGSVVGGLLTGGPIGMATGIVTNFIEQAFDRAEGSQQTTTKPPAEIVVEAGPSAASESATAPGAAAAAYARADQLGVGTA